MNYGVRRAFPPNYGSGTGRHTVTTRLRGRSRYGKKAAPVRASGASGSDERFYAHRIQVPNLQNNDRLVGRELFYDEALPFVATRYELGVS